MTASESGQTGHVSLRDIWPNETLDFTPWLANNLHLLGEAIGMKLSLISDGSVRLVRVFGHIGGSYRQGPSRYREPNRAV